MTTTGMETQTQEHDELAQAVSQACYNEILPHLEVYKSSQDPQQTMSLMAPYHFRRFVEGAHRSLCSLTVEVMRHIYEDLVTGQLNENLELVELKPNFSFESEVRNRLIPCTNSFFSALGHFEQLLMGYRQKLQNAGQRAENQGMGWGVLGAAIGSAVLGPVGALLGSYGAGYFGGSLIDKEIQADAEHLLQAFDAMLGEYDNAMSQMVDSAYQMMGNYHQAVELTIDRITNTERKKLPF